MLYICIKNFKTKFVNISWHDSMEWTLEEWVDQINTTMLMFDMIKINCIKFRSIENHPRYFVFHHGLKNNLVLADSSP